MDPDFPPKQNQPRLSPAITSVKPFVTLSNPTPGAIRLQEAAREVKPDRLLGGPLVYLSPQTSLARSVCERKMHRDSRISEVFFIGLLGQAPHSAMNSCTERLRLPERRNGCRIQIRECSCAELIAITGEEFT